MKFEQQVEQAIPVDAKDGFVGCKYSSTDNACLVVFAPGSTNDIKVAKKSLLKLGWSVEEEKYKGYLVLVVKE